MNGSRHADESESKPLHVCPICLHKLTWNLQLDPAGYCRKLGAFSEKYVLEDEAEYYSRAVKAPKR